MPRRHLQRRRARERACSDEEEVLNSELVMSGRDSARTVNRRPASMTSLSNELLDLSDRLGGIEILGTRFRAVHDGVTSIELERIFKRIQSLTRRLITRIDDPTISSQQCRRSKIAVAIPPIAGTRGRAACTENARRGPIDFFLILFGLKPLTIGRCGRTCLQPRLH